MGHVVVGLDVGQLRLELRYEGFSLLPEIVIIVGSGPVKAKLQKDLIQPTKKDVLEPVLPFLLDDTDYEDKPVPSKQHDVQSQYSPNILSHNNKVDNVLLEDLMKSSPVAEQLLKQIKEGLVKYTPELCTDGVGGVYFLRNANGDIAGVFKPNDEEPNAPNNPKGCQPEFDGSFKGVKEGTVAGEGAVNECAAYLLDKGHFSSVPFTTLVRCESAAFHDEGKTSEQIKSKIGSLQQYVPHDSSCEDIGASLFPKNEVHKIAILDLRTLNTDRHLGNILVKKTSEGHKLIPIDHGLCLPSALSDGLFEWITWPQAKLPFDPEVLKYIESLDPDEDIKLLKSLLPIRDESLTTLKICTLLLKTAAREGLTLYEIAAMMCRLDSLAEKCDLEMIAERATKRAQGADFFTAVQDEINSAIAQRKPKVCRTEE